MKDAIARFEHHYGQSLPTALRQAVLDGSLPQCPALFETEDRKVAGWITEFWPVDCAEHESYVSEYAEICLSGILPAHLLPVAFVANADRIVVSLSGADCGSVYYWAWSEEPQPESNSCAYLRRIATDFTAFLAGLRSA